MATVIEVKGLAECQANFRALLRDTRTKIANDAMREMAWRLARPMRAATYTTFAKQSGKIQSGLSVIVQKEFSGTELKAHVVEYPQSITGPDPVQQLFRKHMRLKGHRPGRKYSGPDKGARVDLAGVAYWWRFLEFGTQMRRAMRTPNFLKTGKISSNPKRQGAQRAQAASWQSSPSRGGITSRSWLRPIAASTSPSAIDGFRDVLLDEIDKAVNAYTK